MNSSPRRRQTGFALNTAIFVITCISITSGATLALYKAYIEMVAKPKEVVQVEQLSKENERLKTQLWQEKVLNAARVLEMRANFPASGKQPDAIRFRGLSEEQIRVQRVSEALDTLERVFGSDEFKRSPEAFSKGFDEDEILHLRAELKDRGKWVADHMEARHSRIDAIVERDAERGRGAEEK